MRTYSDLCGEPARRSLDRLLERPEPQAYRRLMDDLGESLGYAAGQTLPPGERVLLLCTNDDADFLATGVLRSLERRGCSVRLACYWNERRRVGTMESAPIVRRYVEAGDVSTLVVVKSIVSSSCVVRTILADVLEDRQPERILVLAPVMLVGAEDRLAAEFDPKWSSKFRYFWFAQDDEKKANGEVVPGVGGSVYELLGVGTAETKNRYSPELVRLRRDAFQAAP